MLHSILDCLLVAERFCWTLREEKPHSPRNILLSKCHEPLSQLPKYVSPDSSIRLSSQIHCVQRHLLQCLIHTTLLEDTGRKILQWGKSFALVYFFWWKRTEKLSCNFNIPYKSVVVSNRWKQKGNPFFPSPNNFTKFSQWKLISNQDKSLQ